MKKFIPLFFILLSFSGFAQQQNADSLKSRFGKNNVSFNTLGIIVGNLSLSYERFFKKGYFSVAVPLIINVLPKEYLQIQGYFESGAATGLNFNFYPFGQGRAYFLGQEFLIGEFNDNKFWAWTLTNGVLFQHSERVNMSMNLGIGYVSTTDGGKFTDLDPLVARFTFNIGYRFSRNKKMKNIVNDI